jgi:S1-C subfamily serine protease
MYKNTWKSCHASVCSINFLDYTYNFLGSGTGFKIGNHIITNHHVFIGYLGAEHIEITFVEEDGHTFSFNKRYTKSEFLSFLKDSMPENSWDFAILELDDQDFVKISSLELSDDKIDIGESIAVLGFPLMQKHLSIKGGIVSSFFKEAGVDKIQIDSTINKGNSGGPLIDVSTNKVIGVITRKNTGLTRAFNELIKSFNDNIDFLQKSQAMMRIGNFSPKETLILGQEQMRITALEIERSSNVGIGYAFSLNKINDYFK